MTNRTTAKQKKLKNAVKKLKYCYKNNTDKQTPMLIAQPKHKEDDNKKKKVFESAKKAPKVCFFLRKTQKIKKAKCLYDKSLT